MPAARARRAHRLAIDLGRRNPVWERRIAACPRVQLVVELASADAVPVEVGTHGQENDILCGIRDVHVGEKAPVARFSWRELVSVADLVGKNQAGVSGRQWPAGSAGP